MVSNFLKKFSLILFIFAIFLSLAGCSSTNNKNNGDKDGGKTILSAYEINRENREFRMLLGRYYVISKQFEKATEDDGGTRRNWDDGFTYVLRKNSLDIEAAISLADAYLKWGDYLIDNGEPHSEALEKYLKAEEILNEILKHRDRAKIRFEIARIGIRYQKINLGSDNFDEMVRKRELFDIQFDEAKKRDKDYETINDYTAGEIGAYLLDIDRISTAKELLRSMSSQGSREPKVHYELSRVHRENDLLEFAEEDLIRARDYCQEQHPLDPSNPGKLMYADDELKSKIVNALGEIYLIRSKRIPEETGEKQFFLEKAKEHFEEASLIYPENVEAYINLGNISYNNLTRNRKERIQKAISDYKKATIKLVKIKKDSVELEGVKLREIISKVVTLDEVNNELFYKLGYLYYLETINIKEKMKNNIKNNTEPKLTREKYEEYLEKSHLCFNVAFTKGSQEYRNNPNINFALGNIYYYEGMYLNCLNHYQKVIDYYFPFINEKYKDKSDTNPVVQKINYELARAYNNLAAAQYNLFKKTKNPIYFEEAQKNFLQGQEYYFSYNRTIENPHTSNLTNLFVGKNVNISKNTDYEPLIYQALNPQLKDIVK